MSRDLKVLKDELISIKGSIKFWQDRELEIIKEIATKVLEEMEEEEF